MIVGLQIFIEKKEMALDSNFWCGCPENIQNQCFFLTKAAIFRKYNIKVITLSQSMY